MRILKKIKELENQLKIARKKGLKVGFVPTMGALHKGHLSLIKQSRKCCDITVCSIFINPTQFNDKKDFEKYPVTIENDVKMLERANCDLLFLPNVKEMYPKGFKNDTRIDFGYLAKVLEGEHRPGHFDGMAQIVEKLLRIVSPDYLFMGQKDYQQQLIVSQLIKKRRLKVQLIVGQTLRERDGLAMSSRNVRLGPKARKMAVEISKTLKGIKSALKTRKPDVSELEQWGFSRLSNSKGFEVEYVAIRNAENLKPPKQKNEKLVALIAAKIAGVRLIDNMLLN